MSALGLPDPSMHTIYIVDPSQMFTRYAAAFAATARMREGAQAGFLVLARLAYLAFGVLPGFFATRYLFALITIVPAYLLVRKLYGIPAGALAIVALLSSPVIITAWGTDYPDSAVVSYVVGAVACLAMPCRDRWRPVCLVVASGLLTLAVWSHGMGFVLAATTIAVYAAVRLLHDRKDLVRHGVVLAGTALCVTALLTVASGLVLGQFDFVRPMLRAAAFLSQPGQMRLWHTPNWRWAKYLPYLLVPPSVIAAFWVSFVRRPRAMATPQAFVGLVCTAQFAVFAYLQFYNHVQTLEMHYFSSTIWGVVCLALVVTLAEIARPLWARPLLRWLPVLVLVAVPLAYEADPHVPSFEWWTTGAALAAVPVVLAGIVRVWIHVPAFRSPRKVALVLAVAATVVAMTGSLLVLTVAPRSWGPVIDPPSGYSGALGGSATGLIDWYQISADLPSFVGNPTYRGEQLLMWVPSSQVAALMEPIGMFHAGFNLLPNGFPVLSFADAAKLARRRPAELLLLSTTGAGFEEALVYLGPYRPALVRSTVMHQGTAVLHAWLLVLGLFARHAV